MNEPSIRAAMKGLEALFDLNQTIPFGCTGQLSTDGECLEVDLGYASHESVMYTLRVKEIREQILATGFEAPGRWFSLVPPTVSDWGAWRSAKNVRLNYLGEPYEEHLLLFDGSSRDRAQDVQNEIYLAYCDLHKQLSPNTEPKMSNKAKEPQGQEQDAQIGEVAAQILAAVNSQIQADAVRNTPQPIPLAKLSKHYTPADLAKIYEKSWDTVKKRLDDGDIRHVKHTTKDYQIHVDDLPNGYR